MHILLPKPALSLAHCLRPPTRGRPPNVGPNMIVFFFFQKMYFADIKIKIKISFTFFFFPLLSEPKKLSNAKDNTNLNT